MKMKTLGVVVLASIFLMSTGCQKKTTKVGTTPDDTPAQTEEVKPEPTEEFRPSDEDVFETVDMDAKAREVLVPIYFEYDQYDLRPDEVEKLARTAKFLEENASFRILVEGHADERGSNEYNIGLGENRAKAVKNYLAAYGLEANRFEITSYGREVPAVPNCDTEECHRRNRRVEWKILAK